MHGEVQAQMLMGLVGAIVVEGPDDDARRAAGIGERVLVVRQTQDQDGGKTPDASMTAGLPVAPVAGPATPVPATQVDTRHELLCTINSGIDQISLNGTPVPVGDAPDESLALLTIAPGGTQLWRILNGATDAFLDLSIVDANGQPLPMQVVARDGAPLHRRRRQAAEAFADDRGSIGTARRPARSAGRRTAARHEGLPRHPRGRQPAAPATRLPERRLAVVEAAADASGVAMQGMPMPMQMPMPTSTATTRDHFSGLLARHTDHRRTIALAEYPRPGTR